MAEDRNSDETIPKNEHGQSFPDRPAGERSRYDPEEEMPDPEQVERDRLEEERIYGEQAKNKNQEKNKNKDAA